MARILTAVIALVLFVAACAPAGNSIGEQQISQKGEAPLKAIWLAYYEMPFQGLSKSQFFENAEEIMGNISKGGFNAVFCHIRPYCDAIYPSKIFPWSNAHNRDIPQGTDPGYDPLEILITSAKNNGLEFHAWINPYRVATALPTQGEVYETLAPDHPVRLWLTDDDTANDNNVSVITENGGRSIYLNPAVLQVNRLICDGVREILNNYPVDGIHFDDYFYPTTDPKFDSSAYEQYIAEGGKETLDQWRRNNVNAMMSAVWAVAHSYGVKFGVSPAAAISGDKTDRNYTRLYADVRLWARQKGYVDYIAPQLYFGYNYPLEDYRFSNLLNQWIAIEKHSDLKIYIGLGAYKQGTVDAGSDEWQTEDDIIFRQSADALRLADGFAIFSYSSVFK